MKQLDAYDQRRANRAKENVEAGLKAVEKVGYARASRGFN